jgi:Ni,Fe-hydrogenase maturation factor
VVDAVVGVAPGEIVVRPLASLVGRPSSVEPSGRPGPGPTPRSTHLLPVEDVLALAAIVRPGLPDGSFVGIGGASFGFGDGLSPAVAAGLPAFERAIAAEAARLAAMEGPGRP